MGRYIQGDFDVVSGRHSPMRKEQEATEDLHTPPKTPTIMYPCSNRGTIAHQETYSAYRLPGLEAEIGAGRIHTVVEGQDRSINRAEDKQR